MRKIEPRRAIAPPSFFAKLLLPFAVPVFLTLGLLILVGDRWPRDIASGSGLKSAGLVTSAITACAVWWITVRHEKDVRVRKFAAVLSVVTGALGWPVWSVGFLPSINGAALGAEQTVRMTLERVEATQKSKLRGHYHWAWLRDDSNPSRGLSGRYFISEDQYVAWSKDRPATVDMTIAQGLLGADVVTSFK